MLPGIEQFKIVMIGDKRNNATLQTYAAIWHEAIAGRKVSDIISCFRAFLQANRDMKNVVIWLDN